MTKITKSDDRDREISDEKAAVTLPGRVEKVVRSADPSEPEKAQIEVEGADHLYRELRVPNNLEQPNGEKASLKPGAKVDVTIEAHSDSVKPTKE